MADQWARFVGAARADDGIFTVDTLMAFLTPRGYPVNVLVMGTRGYKFRNY